MLTRRRLAGALAVAAVAGCAGLFGVPPAAAEEILCMPTAREPFVGEATWSMRRLAARSIWPLATGAGVTVAVIGEPVAPGNAQLSPGVQPTTTITTPQIPDPDCSGVGTVVAGLIAAQPDPARTSEVAGLAPGVRLVPIAVGEAALNQAATSSAEDLTAAFAAALAEHASVILVTAASAQDTPELRAAVAEAIDADVLVIAAGSVDPKAAAGAAAGPTYPTAYPDVLGVVGVDEYDRPVPGSDAGAYIDIAAPSTALESTGPTRSRPAALAHTLLPAHPTAGAAFVAATAALVRQTYPRASWLEVARRIVLTADPVVAGVGWGVVNPYRAVTATALPTSAQRNRGPATVTPMTPDPGVAASTRLQAGLIAGGGLGIAAVALAVGAALRAGSRRGWQPGQERQDPDTEPSPPPAVSRPSAMA